MTQELQDSGERRVFASGAQRDRGSLKPRPDLISPHAALREGMIFALGAQKYETRNWEKGMPIGECLASAQRHIEQWKRGDTDEDHLAQARWNLGAAIHYEEEIKAGRMDPAIDDMPRYATPKLGDRRTLADGTEEVYLAMAAQEDTVIGKPILTSQDMCDLLELTFRSHPYGVPIGTAPEDVPTFYVCGPMTGLPFSNFPAFDGARDLGRALGYDMISPADMDRKEWGVDPIADPVGWEQHMRASRDTLTDECLDRDYAEIRDLIVKRGDGLAVLPDWEKSKGTNTEIAMARWRGLRFVDARDWSPLDMGL